MAAIRAALTPLGLAFSAAMRLRRRLYEQGHLRTHPSPLPVVSVGNLTVGGTGKTPVAAWVASRLRARARPAIVLRGYGADEVEVHRRLSPDVPVVADADRVAAVLEAKRLGADVVVADDAFQHRRMGRVADIVLVSVEQLRRPLRALPAGPWREGLDAAARADLLVFTRKSASSDEARQAVESVAAASSRPFAIVHLAPAGLVNVSDGATVPLEGLRGRAVLAVAAVGDPGAFRDQLAAAGAQVTLVAFRDHHGFTAADAAALSRRTPAGGLVVCTLKDAVKLAALWPGPSPLWYLSQQLVVEHGAEHLDQLLERVLGARTGATNTAG